jgi:hypothetical protein
MKYPIQGMSGGMFHNLGHAKISGSPFITINPKSGAAPVCFNCYDVIDKFNLLTDKTCNELQLGILGRAIMALKQAKDEMNREYFNITTNDDNDDKYADEIQLVEDVVFPESRIPTPPPINEDKPSDVKPAGWFY